MMQICVFNTRLVSTHYTLNYAIHGAFLRMVLLTDVYTRVGILIVATIYLQLIQNRYMFRRFTVLNIVTSIVYNRCQRCGSRRIPLAAPVALIEALVTSN